MHPTSLKVAFCQAPTACVLVQDQESKLSLTAGVLQEKLATTKYGLLQQRFPHLNTLNGVQSVACFVWAAFLLLIFPPARDSKVAPITAYWLPGVTNSVGPACGFQALKNISYPAQVYTLYRLQCAFPAMRTIALLLHSDCTSHSILQVLAKSCKMVPVMIMGTLIGGKFYSALEYGCALVIAAGISLFATESSAKVVRKLAAPNAPLGYFLCLLNLTFDGYTNAAQVKNADT